MKKLCSGLVGFGLLLSSGAALAQQQQWSGSYSPAFPPPQQRDVDNIGNAGQIVFSVERLAVLSIARQKDETETAGVKSSRTAKYTTFGLFGFGGVTPSDSPRLALDVFVMKGLSVGGSFVYWASDVNLELESGGTTSESDLVNQTWLTLHPRLGYAFQFNETWGLWARGGFAWSRLSQDFPGDSGEPDSEDTWNWFQLPLEAMVVMSPFKHFALLAGPFVDIGVGGSYETKAGALTQEADSKLTVFGLNFAVAGYWP
jgi:hypothetical protein